MEKRKKWPLLLILIVIALTIYNVLPTLFYYTKPLKAPLSEAQGMRTASTIANRFNEIELESLRWLRSFCDLCQIKPISIQPSPENPQILLIQCTKTDDAVRLRQSLLRAGSLIPFLPAQLSPLSDEPTSKTVSVLRRIGFRMEESLFAFTPKLTKNGSLAPLYADWILDRAALLASATSSGEPITPDLSDSSLLDLAARINEWTSLFGQHPESFSRFFSQLGSQALHREEMFTQLITAMDALRDQLKRSNRTAQEKSLASAEGIFKKQKTLFLTGSLPLSADAALRSLRQELPPNPTQQRLSLSSSPFFSDLLIDWERGCLTLALHSDLAHLQSSGTESEREQLQTLLINELARITQSTGETFLPGQTALFSISLHHLSEASRFLLLDLDLVAQKQQSSLIQQIRTHWHPQHPDLQLDHFPIVDQNGFDALSEIEKQLCLHSARSNQSLVLVARGLDRIFKEAERSGDETALRAISADINSLINLLHQNGFVGHAMPGGHGFEQRDAFQMLSLATRENFLLKGQRFAAVECSDLEQRLLTENRIETRLHEELLKWRDEYAAASVHLNASSRFDIPKPTKSVFWNNLSLSFKKYLRGDDRKILRWGLDLSGGKTVQIELRDIHNRPVTSESDLKQGINELFNRVNKMGVSDVSIRQVGTKIVLDFPGSTTLTASELIKASSMSFHIVNEKFSSQHAELAPIIHRFLQNVWNEAVIANRIDAESVNAIAYRHLQGEDEAARLLVAQGLQLASPDALYSSNVDDALSKVAILRDREGGEWRHPTHPLLFVFANRALEGSNLNNIRASYDPSNGNFLSFEIKGSGPREDLHAWTSQFSKERIAGTPYETHTRGQGWRMAVILNDSVISAPVLNSALRDSAMISGSFSQREINQLASDLKAGSLTFTPHILSEKNVSPELGKLDRNKGLIASVAALILIIVSMVGYYRFSGLIASIAVLFNLLIMWATLQNLQATLSLAGIAGIILTVGMAIDANVLVFERIKEEFAISGRIGAAIQTGYQKAFSAILDSNVTTIIAALILLNFDAGPIKGFAITLIIGIASSMFTALFMTRTFFSYWLQKSTKKILVMSNWVRASSFDFLKRTKIAFTLAALTIAIGSFLLLANRSTIFGMDFTGGFAVDIELEGTSGEPPFVDAVSKAFIQQGASSQEFQIRELHPSNHLRILFAATMLMHPPSVSTTNHHPQVEWIIDTLHQNGLSLTPACLAQIDTNWTSMSGQMSDSMRNHALLGLGLAFLCIFIYLVIRFESAYAKSALICLLHDVLITLGLMGFLHALKVPIQIDLNTVAALMTIVGYSLNDTIIIFDRIREELALTRTRSLRDVINHALNATLSRTAITSGTTLLVLLTLVAIGKSSIFSFALVMTIGVIFGTFSSWFIAAPLLFYFYKKETIPVPPQRHPKGLN